MYSAPVYVRLICMPLMLAKLIYTLRGCVRSPRHVLQDVTFNEQLTFDVEEKHAYVNLCLWCRHVNRVDRQGKPLRPEKDTLLGHVRV